MDLGARIDADLKVAMITREKLTTEVLRGLKSVILYQEVALKKRGEGLSDNEIEQLLAKEVKKRDESAELFERGGNKQSAEKERQEKVIIQVYLPAPFGEAELQKIVDEVVADIPNAGPQAMGQVMAAVRAKVGSRGAISAIAKLVKSKLQ